MHCSLKVITKIFDPVSLKVWMNRHEMKFILQSLSSVGGLVECYIEGNEVTVDWYYLSQGVEDSLFVLITQKLILSAIDRATKLFQVLALSQRPPFLVFN